MQVLSSEIRQQATLDKSFAARLQALSLELVIAGGATFSGERVGGAQYISAFCTLAWKERGVEVTGGQAGIAHQWPDQQAC